MDDRKHAINSDDFFSIMYYESGISIIASQNLEDALELLRKGNFIKAYQLVEYANRKQKELKTKIYKSDKEFTQEFKNKVWRIRKKIRALHNSFLDSEVEVKELVVSDSNLGP